MKKENELIILNLSYNYPVNWGIEKVLADFIQNFYDATGYGEFENQFLYTYENGVLTMMTENHPFELDWLQYMGASSKRGNEKHYAGRFGEGFKIAALVATRDLKWDIVMESEDWRIHVSKKKQVFEGGSINMMAYEKTYREDDNRTVLTLSGVKQEQYDIFLGCLNDFYYPGNSLFGECIEESDDFAVYTTKTHESTGAVYGSLLRRQYLGVPVIFCHHSFGPDMDRDREYYTEWATLECIKEVIAMMHDENVLRLLAVFRPCWKKTKQGRYPDMGEIVRTLIMRVADNPACRKQFMEKYGEKIIAYDRSDFCYRRAAYSIALAWYKDSEYGKKTEFVKGWFAKLGIKTLDALCRENNGYVTCDDAGNREKPYIDILERVARDIFGNLICYERLPECRVIINDKNLVLGQTFVANSLYDKKNAYGMETLSSPSFVAVQRDLLSKGNFPRAMSVYLHELLHQYGNDSSLSFRKALLLMNEIILKNAERFDGYQDAWDCLEQRQ